MKCVTYDNSAQKEVWLLNAKMINAKIIFMIFKKNGLLVELIFWEAGLIIHILLN